MKINLHILLLVSFCFILNSSLAEEVAPNGKAKNGKVENGELNKKIKQYIQALDESESKDAKKVKQFIEKHLNAKSDEDFLKIYEGFLQEDPDSPDMLNLAAIMSAKMGDHDKAKKYIDKSLELKKSDRTFEMFVVVYVLRTDMEGLSKKINDLEGIEKKSSIIIRALLALSEHNKDKELFERTSDYIIKHKIKNPKVIQNQKQLARFFTEREV